MLWMRPMKRSLRQTVQRMAVAPTGVALKALRRCADLNASTRVAALGIM
jgi:hypothetical protein